jgi:peptidoglycan/xylan/chitin deacetylase (PgdA/CDA1 family)
MKKTVKRIILLTGLGGVAAFVFFFKDRLFSRALERSTTDEVLFHLDTMEKVVALTIDDGPHPELTSEILDVLAEYQVPATFFVIGDRIEGNESLLERMVVEGHELGNHLMNDQRSIQLEPAEFSQQLAEAHGLLRSFGPVHWFRPGSGWYNTRMLEQVRPYGYRVVVGSVYPFDAHIQSVEFVSTYILGNVRPGSIIILHDGEDRRKATPEILRRVLPVLQEQGYRFETLTGMAG